MKNNYITPVVAENESIENKENSYLKIEHIAIINSLEMTKKFLVLYKPMFIQWADFFEHKSKQETLIEDCTLYEDYKLAFFAQKMSFEKGSCEQCIDKIIKAISETLEFVETEKEISYYSLYGKLCNMLEEIENFEVYEQLMIRREACISINERSTLEEIYEYREHYLNSFWLKIGFSVMEKLHNLIEFMYEQSNNVHCNFVNMEEEKC